ncbi:hypothetical protein JW916_07740 [Candidatus Sumerlaeota bacterium]|nr:hypothetical protein [Candidatus Sumerlaeota bacterium]
MRRKPQGRLFIAGPRDVRHDRLTASALAFVLLLVFGPSSALGNGTSPPAVFAESDLIQVPLVSGETGTWILVDDRAQEIRRGRIETGVRSLLFSSLPPGGYFVLWGESTEAVRLDAPASANRLGFVVRPGAGPLPEDHFFAVNQPGLIEEAKAGRAGGDSDCAFAFAAMKSLGIRRFRTPFLPDPPRNSGDDYDWRALDRLERDASEAGVRFIAVLDVEPRLVLALPEAQKRVPTDKTARARALLRRYGFKLDEFSLCDELTPDLYARRLGDGLGRSQAGELLEGIASVGAALKVRSPQCVVSLGCLVVPAAADAATKNFLDASAGACDVLDYRADGTFADFVRTTEALDRLVERTGWMAKYRAVGCAGIAVGQSESIAAQRVQASETIRKLVWARSLGYRYFAAARLTDARFSSERGGLGAEKGTAFFDANRSPRLVAGAWAHAVVRLGGTAPVARLRFHGDRIEIHAFEREGETILVVWAPETMDRRAESAEPARADRRGVVSLLWPEEIGGEVYDPMGRRAGADRLRKKTGRERYFLADSEPAYLVLATPSETVSW